jgi:Na+-translocating ferredoxin:NAD+ oxidoreductase RnfG subunit
MNKKTKDKINECIRAGNNFTKTKDILAKEGITEDFHSSFYRMKQEVFPSEARDSTLLKLSERKKENKEQKKPTKAWSKQRQTESDTSVFASVLNDGIFYLAPCPQKGLTVEDVQKINVGGAIVGLVSYYTDVNLNHPIIIFVTRTIMLVLKIRAMCYRLQEGMSAAAAAAKERLPGQGSIGGQKQ